MIDTILVASAVVLLSFLLFLFVRRGGPNSSAADASSLLMVQQHVESLRQDLRESLQDITENVNQQLAAVAQQLQSQTHNVGDRLDSATRVIGDVQKNLGELGRATQEIKELGMSVSKLDELLRAPKLRGGLGEFLLEDLLRQVLPAKHFSMQYRFRSGCVVDAIIRTSDRLAPVDSKFPLENFRRMAACDDEAVRRSYQRAFANDVRKHIDAIAGKYIVPDEGTFPFALMYIPAENIYYEVIIKDECGAGDGGGESLHSYALSRKVVPVSPNSFYAYLQVIALGLRGLSIEESARDIQDTLSRLQADIVRLREVFDTMGNHMENARKKFEDADRHLSSFEGKLDRAVDAGLLKGGEASAAAAGVSSSGLTRASAPEQAAALEEAKLIA